MAGQESYYNQPSNLSSALVDCKGQKRTMTGNLGFEINESEPHIVLKSGSKIFFNDPQSVLRSTVQVKWPMTDNLEFEISQSEPCNIL